MLALVLLVLMLVLVLVLVALEPGGGACTRPVAPTNFVRTSA